MSRIIHYHVTLNCSKEQAFEMFINPHKVQTWLSEIAVIDPRVGGNYELYWDKDNLEVNSTQGCRITALETNALLCFDWKGPIQFADIMNTSDPLTHVTVVFIPVNVTWTEVHLIHSGWGSDATWEQARLWFSSVWEHALNGLKAQDLRNIKVG